MLFDFGHRVHIEDTFFGEFNTKVPQKKTSFKIMK